MTCPRCGTVFEGNFCPACGNPAPRPPVPAAAPAPAYAGLCPRCGTPFAGNYCPRCGLAAGSVAYLPPRSTTGRSILSVIWTISVAGFLILVALNLVGLLIGPTLVVPGVQGIASGRTSNPTFSTDSSGWSFVALTPLASGSYVGSGGNPDGYLGLTLSNGTSVRGMWTQTVTVTGSAPFAVRLDLDVLVSTTGSLSGRLIAALDPAPGTPIYGNATTVESYGSPTGAWTRAPTVDLGDRAPSTGTYYLKVVFVADANGGTTTVGLDNVRLRWITDAAVFFYVPLPYPMIVFVSQDPALFLGYYGFLIGVIVLACLYYTVRERKEFRAALFAPFDRIGARLRSRSAWVAVAQTWMAVTFVQVAIILVLRLIGPPPSTPIVISATNAWVYLFELANASVYEELVFRALMIGVPMALGSLVLNARTASPWAPKAKTPGHAFRYLVGGNLRSTSSREALLAGWILLFASSSMFGLAHAPSWGFWKIIPALVAGLGFGYLFLRHGIGAAILAHFATDYVAMTFWEGVGGVPLDILVSLLFLALAAAGSGFLVWYLLYAFGHGRVLMRRFTKRGIAQPAVAGTGMPPTVYSPPPPVPPYGAPAAPPPGAGMPAGWQPPPNPAVARDPNQVPPGYAPTYRPPPYGFPPVKFQCPFCGWVEATYDTGRFTCRRCGRTA